MVTNIPGQVKAIDQILFHYEKQERLVQFVAPTGSGKTFMIANVISRILDKPDSKIVFIIFTLSNAELPKQFRDKLDEYKDSLNLKYEVEYFESPSKNTNRVKDAEGEIKPKNKDCNVFIFGTQSFGKGTIYSENDSFSKFIIQDKKEQGYKIIYIRDEAHIGDKIVKNEGKREQELIQKEADFIIKMTATPDDKIQANAKIVFVDEKDLSYQEDDCYHNLLKDRPLLNSNIPKVIDDKVILDTAIKTFKEIKQQYRKKSIKNDYPIKPCMLIQIDSKNQEGKEVKEDGKDIENIVKKLEENNLSWVIYLANRKESSMKEASGNKTNEVNLKSISSNNSDIDVVIFKIGPATGWDIPRACMLVQLRKVSSSKLNQQTIGRIKRNPNKKVKVDEIYRKYWIYSSRSEKDWEICKYELKKDFAETEFPSLRLSDKTKKLTKQLFEDFGEKLKSEFFKKNKEKIVEIYSRDFENKKSVIIERLKYKSETGDAEYQRELENIIEIKMYLFSVFNKNQWLNKIGLEAIYNQYFARNMHFDQFCFIVFRDFLKQNLSKMKDDFFSDHKPQYSINYNNHLPEEFITKKKVNNVVDIKEIKDIYAYQPVVFTDKKDEEQTKQYLDSDPESIFLYYLIEQIKERGLQDKLDVVAKNPQGSPLSMDYWNKGKYSKAYIDFVIKFKNEKTFLYIEVKSVDDYDEVKTTSIQKHFSSYKKSITNPNVNIFLVIIKVDKKEITDSKRITDEGIWITKKDDNFYPIRLFEILKSYQEKVK